MILKHPLNTENAANRLAIEKYKDRLVVMQHGRNNLWYINGEGFVAKEKKNSDRMTFKDALKKTKHFSPESLIFYHFLSDISDEKGMPITEFSHEDVYSCSTIKFDLNEKYKSNNQE